MRVVLLLVLALACKDKTKAEAPRVGSASAVATEPAASSPRLPKLVGTPPVKAGPLDAARITKLSKRDFEGWTRDVRLADERGLEVRYRSTSRPSLTITVLASPCFDCLPMQEAQWTRKSDALRSLIAPELRDHEDTTWEMGTTEIAGTPYIWTHHVAYVAPDARGMGGAFGTAYTLFFNDGTNMIRVMVEYTDDAPSRDAMLRAAPKRDLEQAAKAFIDQFVHFWG